MKHEIVKTDNYLLIVDDSEIKEGDLVYRSLTHKDIYILDDFGSHLHNRGSSGDGYKKIIAHLPLNNSPFLESVDVLPPFDVEDDVEKLADTFMEYFGGDKNLKYGYVHGWTDCKEKYKYTEEDMLHAFEKGAFFGTTKTGNTHYFEEIIQSLSQPKVPIGFECETEWVNSYGSPTIQYDAQRLKPKTTTNSQGQTVWAGKYIYE